MSRLFRLFVPAFQAARTHMSKTALPVASRLPLLGGVATGGMGWLGLHLYTNTTPRFTVYGADEDAPSRASTSAAAAAASCCGGPEVCPDAGEALPEVMTMVGMEVGGLEGVFEDLCVESNASENAKKPPPEDEDEDYDEDDEENLPKSMPQLIDVALMWHEKTLLKNASGGCLASDQMPEGSFRPWVAQSDAMFRARDFGNLQEKFLEEYNQTRGPKTNRRRDPQLLWRMARLTFLMGNEVENNSLKFWKEAMVYATEAIQNFDDVSRMERNPDVKHINYNCCWKCHLWFGIIMAKLGGMQDSNLKRIRVALMAKAHLERSNQINPLDPIPNFALAKWHYEFCKLTAGQARIVQNLGYPYPLTSVETALRYAERANELVPHLTASRTGKFPRNVYLLAELYHVLGRDTIALHHAESLVYQLGPFCVSIEDKRAVERGRVLITKIKNPTPNNPHDLTPRPAKARPTPPFYPDHHNNLFGQKKP